MANNDVWLRSVPSDANPSDVRLYTKPDSASAGDGAIAGTAPLIFSQTGSLKGAGALAGVTSLAFNQTGLLRGSGRLTGTNSVSFGQTGTLRGSGRLVGTNSLVFGQVGTLRSAGALVGSTAISLGQTGVLRGAGKLVGTTSVVFGQTGNLTNSTSTSPIAGTAALAFGQFGTLINISSRPNTESYVWFQKKKKASKPYIHPNDEIQALVDRVIANMVAGPSKNLLKIASSKQAKSAALVVNEAKKPLTQVGSDDETSISLLLLLD